MPWKLRKSARSGSARCAISPKQSLRDRIHSRYRPSRGPLGREHDRSGKGAEPGSEESAAFGALGRELYLAPSLSRRRADLRPTNRTKARQAIHKSIENFGVRSA